MRPSDCDEWARRHHGLITLEASGLSNDSWHRALKAGKLIRVHRTVARLPGAPITATQRICGAVLAAGTGAMASHHSAAHLWGLLPAPTHNAIDLILNDSRRHVDLTGTVVHRPSDRADLAPQRRHGIPCSNVPRTLCDLGAVAPDVVFDAVGGAINRGLISLDALNAFAERHARRGRRGIPALRQAITGWQVDQRPADSVLELAFVRLVRTPGFPEFTFHERIAGWEVDFHFVGTPLIVECDGWSSHGLDRDQFERDRRKDSDLVAAGYVVIRCSYRSIINDQVATAARLRRALAGVNVAA